MMTRGRGGVWLPPENDDVIYEQPLTIILVVAKKPGKQEKKNVLVVGQDDLCVSLWWDIKVAQVVFGPKFSFRAWNLTYE